MRHTRNAPLSPHARTGSWTSLKSSSPSPVVLMFFPRGFIPDGMTTTLSSRILRIAMTFTTTFFLPPSLEVAEGATGAIPSHPGDECGGSLCNRMLGMVLLLYRVGAGMHFSCLWGCGVPRLARVILQRCPSDSSFLLAVYIRTVLHTCGFYTSFHFIYWTLVPFKHHVTTLLLPSPTVLTLQCI